MRPQEAKARAYCRSIGADPDEMIKVWTSEYGCFVLAPRWTTYIGSVV